ncbi:MAG: PTS system mannose/fructose/sorbose family transporter subunit IID [Lachnospiraceae bacterium]|nr:PTS system mannose/fructose/sorbose family transporter subunit IID [Lachnospiraceae bacterium]
MAEMQEKMGTEVAEVKKLTKKDVNKSYWLWQFFSHSNYNYDRYQGTAFAMAMAPIMQKLYGDNPEELKAGLQRHLAFFNTDPNLGSVIHGATIAMEEQRANGADISGEMINGFKTGLMGPMAGIGDAVIQGVVIPIVVALGISIAQQGSIFGSLLVLIGLPIILMLIAHSCWMYGYNAGNNAITSILSGGRMKKWIGAAGILGTTVMGALISSYVSLSMPIEFSIGEEVFNIQTGIFDAIMPNLLPLALVLIVYALSTKGVKTWKLLVGVFAVGIIGGALGIFG